jgi:hypothetical protein
MCAKIQILIWFEVKYRSLKKRLESCYKIHRKFYISEQLNKDTEKNIYVTQKIVKLCFSLLGGFCPRPKRKAAVFQQFSWLEEIDKQ